MAVQLYIGFIGEGVTDTKFLSEIITNTFTETALDCHGDVIVEDIVRIKAKNNSFVEMMIEASKNAFESGLSILCIHADANRKTLDDVLDNKFKPLYERLLNLDSKVYCINIVAVIPITETESWMLADKELLKEKINAKDKTDADLGIEKDPESYADPKLAIENAIRIAQQGKTKKRRRDLSIADLYEELGQAISIEKLKTIPSFCRFEENVRNAFVKMGYLIP